MDEFFMRAALAEAESAAAEDEVPVGAVVVKDGVVIAAAHNEREQKKDISAHAELTALRRAAAVIGDWRLSGCTLYVTLEPCPMCAGAILTGRVGRVVFGASDPASGAFGSALDLPRFQPAYRPEVTPGVLADDCARLLSDFFRRRRTQPKYDKANIKEKKS